MSTSKDLECAFRVVHPNGDCVKGFTDLQSAKDDATARNTQASKLGLSITYTAIVKP